MNILIVYDKQTLIRTSIIISDDNILHTSSLNLTDTYIIFDYQGSLDDIQSLSLACDQYLINNVGLPKIENSLSIGQTDNLSC